MKKKLSEISELKEGLQKLQIKRATERGKEMLKKLSKK